MAVCVLVACKFVLAKTLETSLKTDKIMADTPGIGADVVAMPQDGFMANTGIGDDVVAMPQDGFCCDAGMHALRLANKCSDKKGAFTKLMGRQPTSSIAAIVAGLAPPPGSPSSCYCSIDATLLVSACMHSPTAAKALSHRHACVLFIECLRYRLACTQEAVNALEALRARGQCNSHHDDERLLALQEELARFTPLCGLDHLPALSTQDLVDAVLPLCHLLVNRALVPLAFHGGLSAFLLAFDFGVHLAKRETHYGRHRLSRLDSLAQALTTLTETAGDALPPVALLLMQCSLVPRVAACIRAVMTSLCSPRVSGCLLKEGDETASVAPLGVGWDGDTMMLLKNASVLITCRMPVRRQCSYVSIPEIAALRRHSCDVVDVRSSPALSWLPRTCTTITS